MPDTMKAFLEPKSVALIGISRATGPEAYNALENLVNAGFLGRVYPVNPNADEILGIDAYPSVLDIADDIDLAIISMPRLEVPRIVGECTQKGIRALIIVTQGFADADGEGRAMQDEIVRIARDGGARILGPNTWGTANAFNNFTSGFTPMIMEKRPIGFITQTGFYFGIPATAGKGIDIGNTADIDFTDALEHFESDPDIGLIFLHIEGVKDGRKFMESAARVARKKPILAIKTGKEEEAAKAAQSHTGSLVGKDEVYDAAFRQCGVIRVGEVDEFEDGARALLNLPPMKGKGVAVITPSGGAGILVIDLLRKYRLRLARLSPRTLEELNTLTPDWQRMGNPADIWPAVMISRRPFDEIVSTVLDSLLQDDDVHAVLLLLASMFDVVTAEQRAKILKPLMRGGDKPIVCWSHGPETEQMRIPLETPGGIGLFPTMERALRALSHLNARWRYLSTDGERT